MDKLQCLINYRTHKTQQNEENIHCTAHLTPMHDSYLTKKRTN